MRTCTYYEVYLKREMCLLRELVQLRSFTSSRNHTISFAKFTFTISFATICKLHKNEVNEVVHENLFLTTQVEKYRPNPAGEHQRSKKHRSSMLVNRSKDTFYSHRIPDISPQVLVRVDLFHGIIRPHIHRTLLQRSSTETRVLQILFEKQNNGKLVLL